MAGLCGWLLSDQQEIDSAELTERMVSTLNRFDDSDVFVASAPHWGVGLAKKGDGGKIYRQGDDIAVVLGTPQISDDNLQAHAQQHGIASAMLAGYDNV
jgi:hypothetical protein